MGRKARGEELEKIVSTKLSSGDYVFLDRYAKALYGRGIIEMPTVSHALRLLVKTKRDSISCNKQKQPVVTENLRSDKLQTYTEQLDKIAKLPSYTSGKNRDISS